MRAPPSYGITHMAGKLESRWFSGEPFNLSMPSLPKPCPESLPRGRERRHFCLRWPERALHSRASCPFGQRDIIPYSHSVLSLPHCRSQLQPLRKGCLIYSFGIGGDARWEHYMAREYGCEGHAFDPTIRLRGLHTKRASSSKRESPLTPFAARAPGRLFFHFSGLSTPIAAADTSLYGALNRSTLLPLSRILERLNHTSLQILKLDCEGCEWSVLSDLSAVPRAVRASVQMLVLELHLTSSMVAPTAAQYNASWSNLLGAAWGHMRIQYRHDNIGEFGSPYAAGQTPEELLPLGVPSGQCCVEYVFVRTTASQVGSPT